MVHGAYHMNKSAEHIPFDQFQRYWVTSQIVSFLRKEKPNLDILDIGGYLGYPNSKIQENYLPITLFFKEDNVISLDRKHFTGNNYILGDARFLPVKEKSFDVVNLLDTLEHIPVKERILVIHEEVQASGGVGIIGGPWGNQENVLAEKMLAAYLGSYLDIPNP